MSPQTDKSWCDYKVRNQNWPYQPTLAGCVISQNYLTLSGVLHFFIFNPTALRKAKIVYNFGLSECNRIKLSKLLVLIIYTGKLKYFIFFIVSLILPVNGKQ